MIRDIPITAIEVQKGLWANEKTITRGTATRKAYDLYSEDGYCFYIPENNLDEDGKLFPPSNITYYQFMYSAYSSIEQINENITSTLLKDEYEVA